MATLLDGIAVFYLCSVVHLSCDADNSYNGFPLPQHYESEAACWLDASRQRWTLPKIDGPSRVTLMCMPLLGD